MLETRDLTIRFGGHVAIDHLSCTFQRNTLTMVVGPRGAGKTSCLDLLSGQLRPSAGSVWLGSTDITRSPPAVRARRGIARAFQPAQSFARLSVVENVRLAVQSRRRQGMDAWSVWQSHRNTLERAHALLERAHLGDRAAALAGSLQRLDRSRLALAMLMALEPRVYLFDEPTAGLDEGEAQAMVGLIGALKAQRDKVVLVAQRQAADWRALADRIVVLHRGRLIADGAPDAMTVLPEPPPAGFGAGKSPVASA